jgi:hypothetical protein
MISVLNPLSMALERNITLLTGPHLGGFNRPISLPEMIECISTMSALCMEGRLLKNQ